MFIKFTICAGDRIVCCFGDSASLGAFGERSVMESIVSSIGGVTGCSSPIRAFFGLEGSAASLKSSLLWPSAAEAPTESPAGSGGNGLLPRLRSRLLFQILVWILLSTLLDLNSLNIDHWHTKSQRWRKMSVVHHSVAKRCISICLRARGHITKVFKVEKAVGNLRTLRVTKMPSL